MDYKITAFKCQVGGEITVDGGVIVAGLITPPIGVPDKSFYIVCLEPIWPKVSVTEEEEEGEEKEEAT